MKFLLYALLTVLLVVFLNPLLPFWAVMILIAILSTFMNERGAVSFIAGALGMGLAWLGQSLYLLVMTPGDLPNRMGELMGIGTGMSLVVITGIVGFLLGGFSAWTGSLFRRILRREPDNLYRG